MSFVYGSLFSGGGGMDLGFERAGFTPSWHAEVDKDAVSVLRRHWHDVPQLGDVRDIHGGRIAPVDVIQGGSPCQDVSKAGKREGLGGERSGLFFDYVRIVRQMREATNGRYPAVVVLENVDGLLSSNRGRDFAVVLQRLRELGAAVAFRVFDAQFFGVPQRRRRVFLVADFAPVGVGEERAAKVLALRESLCGHPAPGDQARQGSAIAAQDGAGVGGRVFAESGHGWWNDGYGCLRAEGENRPSRPSHVVLEPMAYQCQGTNVGPLGTLRAGNGHVTGGVPFVCEPLAFGGNNCSGPIDVATACLADGWQGDFETETFIVAPWDEAQITSAANRSRRENGSPAPTLNGSGQVSIIAAEIASTIQASAGHHGHSSPRGDGSDNLVALAFNWQAGHGNDDSFRGKSRQYIHRAGDYCGALGVTRQDAVALGFHLTQHPIVSEDQMPAISAGNGKGSSCLGVFERYGLKWIVRRLTPREGERLQGWPEVRQTVTIHVCHTSSNRDCQESRAPAETLSHRWRESAWSAGSAGYPQSAPSAGGHSSTAPVSRSRRAVLRARIDLERRVVELHSPVAFPSSAPNADGNTWNARLALDAATAQAGALLSLVVERATSGGRAASPPSTMPSTPRLSGSRCVVVSGREIEERAADVDTASRAASALLTSTTSEAGQSSQNFDSILRTLSCSVTHAIAGSIPEPIRSASSYDCELTLVSGWTQYTHDGQQISDSARWRLIGNGVATPVAYWIASRLRAAMEAS